MGINTVTLQELCKCIVDCEHKTAPKQTIGIPSIRTTDIKNGRLDLENSNRVSYQIFLEWSQRETPLPGDILLAREAPVGEVGIIPPRAQVCQGQRTVLIRTDENRIHNRYLLYLLLSRPMKHEMLVRAEGSTVPHLNMSDIRKLEIPIIHTLPEQRAIAHILGTLDDKIELNRKMNETLEAIARALFKSWFVDFDPVHAKMDGRRPAGMDDETAALFPNELVWNEELGKEIPRGWGVGRLGDVARNIRESINPDDVETIVPYIGLEHMPKKSITLSEWGLSDRVKSGKFRFNKRDILFGKLRPYFHKVGIAPINGICSTDIVVINVKEKTFYSYLVALLSSSEFVSYCTAISTGTRMPRTKWNDMCKYETIIPSEEVIEIYNDVVHSFIEKIISNIHDSKNLTLIRDTFLPRLVSGQLRILDTEGFLEEGRGKG